MSHEKSIFSRFEAGLDFIEFVRQNYPEILLKWKNKKSVVNQTTNKPEPAIQTNDKKVRNDYET